MVRIIGIGGVQMMKEESHMLTHRRYELLGAAVVLAAMLAGCASEGSTAHTLARLALGMADDVVTATILASAANYVTNLKDSTEQHKMAEQLYFKCVEAISSVGIEIALAGAIPLSDAFLARNSAGQTAWQKVFSKVAR